jgi:hypothetical protein
MKKIKEYTEGFWDKSNKPIPVKFVGRKQFLKQLAAVEKVADTTHYKGWSNCRVCDCHNGSIEYYITANGEQWTWPSGYSHYVEEHKHVPTSKFIMFIAMCYKDIRHREEEDDEIIDPVFKLSEVKKILASAVQRGFNISEAKKIYNLFKERKIK